MVSRRSQSRKRVRRFRGGNSAREEVSLGLEEKEGLTGGGCGCGSSRKTRKSHQKPHKRGGYHFSKKSKKSKRKSKRNKRKKRKTHRRHRRHRGGSWPTLVKQALLPLTTFALQKGWQNKKRKSIKY